MPFATSLYLDRRLMITRAWGHITLDDMRAFRQELAARPEFDPTWAHVFDAGGAVRFDLSSEEIRHLAATSLLAPCARRSLVATAPRDLWPLPHVRCAVRTSDGRIGGGGIHDVRRRHRVGHALTSRDLR